MPHEELANARRRVFVLAPVRFGERDIPAIDREPLFRRQALVARLCLAEDPRFDERPARDHHPGAARSGERRPDFVAEEEIAVADHRNVTAAATSPIASQSAGMVIARLARAAVDEDRIGAAARPPRAATSR